jgi:hypothetical protein
LGVQDNPKTATKVVQFFIRSSGTARI